MTEESKKSVDADPHKTAADIKKFILNFDDIPEETMEVPEWDNITILIKGMTGKSRANFLKRASGESGEIEYDRFYPELIIATVFHPETEEAVFEGADRAAINQKSGAALETVAKVAQRLSGLGSSDVEDAKKDSSETKSSVST